LKTQQRFEALRHTLRHEDSGATKVIRALAYIEKTQESTPKLRACLGYFRRHRRMMDYAYFARCGLPIGSGVVEAACKTLGTQRMKRSGMMWGREGAQAILTIRGWTQSDRFDAAWALIAAHRQIEITLISRVEVHAISGPDEGLPDNVIRIRTP
jgi:hypothetical protein